MEFEVVYEESIDSGDLEIYNETFGNDTELPRPPQLSASSITRASVLFVMAALAFFGNLTLIVNILRKRMKTPETIYIVLLNLAFADILVSTWCILGEAIWYISVSWKGGNLLCKLFKYMQIFALYNSTFITVFLRLQQFIAVKYPMKALSRELCIRIIACFWGLAGVLALPQLLIFHLMKGPFSEEFYQCVTFGSYTHPWQEKVYAVFSILTMFIFPLGVILVTHAIILQGNWRNRKLKKSHEAPNGGVPLPLPPTGSQNRSTPTTTPPRKIFKKDLLIQRAQKKSLKISNVVVTFFVVLWTPYWIIMIISVLVQFDENSLGGLQDWIFFFGMSVSCFNPIIYGVFHIWMPMKAKRVEKGGPGKGIRLEDPSRYTEETHLRTPAHETLVLAQPELNSSVILAPRASPAQNRVLLDTEL